MKQTEKPSENLKAAAGLVASAAAATVAAMAYKVNEEKINAGVDKAADSTKAFIGKASRKLREMADDVMAKMDDKLAEPTDVVEVVDAEPVTEAEPVKEDEAVGE